MQIGLQTWHFVHWKGGEISFSIEMPQWYKALLTFCSVDFGNYTKCFLRNGIWWMKTNCSCLCQKLRSSRHHSPLTAPFLSLSRFLPPPQPTDLRCVWVWSGNNNYSVESMLVRDKTIRQQERACVHTKLKVWWLKVRAFILWCNGWSRSWRSHLKHVFDLTRPFTTSHFSTSLFLFHCFVAPRAGC